MNKGLFLLRKFQKYLLFLCLIFFICFSENAYMEDLDERYYIDILSKVNKIEFEIEKLNQRIELFERDSEKFDSMYDDIKKQYDQLTTEIKTLTVKQAYDSQVLSQKIVEIEIPNSITSRILNTIITIGTLFIGAIGVASISGYLKSKIESMLMDVVAKKLKDEISKEVHNNIYSQIYKQFSDSLNKINNKINEINQYKPVLNMLKEMGDKVEKN